MNTHNAIRRLVDRNAEASKGALKVPPEQTVEHALMVEARLVQAMAARKKKERTAGGAGAADLAESILASRGRRAAERVDDTSEGPAEQPAGEQDAPEFDPMSELIEPPPAGPSALDFLDDADERPAFESVQDDDMGALFETIDTSKIDRIEGNIAAKFELSKQQPLTQPAIISSSAKAHVRKEQSDADRAPKNRARLANLLEEIRGEGRN